MEVGIGRFGHVVVYDDVHSFDIHTTTEEVSGNEDTLLQWHNRLH